MKEYSFLACISVVIAFMIDKKLHTRLFNRPEYYLFLLVIIVFKLLVNGYLTTYIVMYDPNFFSRVRIGTIPAEDFLFGLSMVTISVSIWEFCKTRNNI